MPGSAHLLTSAVAAAPRRRAALHLEAARMPAGEGWLPSLDGLRAFSILLVLVAHLVSDRLAPGGFGVAAFFLISGFLIARLLLAERKRCGRSDLPRFYVRRILRLYPAMLAYVAVVVATYLALGHPVGWTETVATLTYTGNYAYVGLEHAGRPILMPFGPFWSLAVEEHFYLLFAPLLVLLRGRPDRLAWTMAAVCAGEVAWRLLQLQLHPEFASAASPVYYRTDFRLDSMAFGVLAAALCEGPRGRAVLLALGRPAAVAAALAVLLLTFVLRDDTFRQTWRYTLQGLALGALLCAVLFQAWPRPVQRVLNHPLVAWVGRLSYSLYLWHLATPEIVRTLLPHAALPLQWALRFAFSFALAAASYYALETPLLRLRRRFGSAAGQASAPAAASGAALAPA